MQIYSLNYFLVHKMVMRSISGVIFGVFVLPYSTIVTHKQLRIPFVFLCILLFLEFLMYFFVFRLCFVLFFFNENCRRPLSTIIRPKSTNKSDEKKKL